MRARPKLTRLTREGFKGYLSEFLDNTQNWGGPKSGVSGVMQLGSARSARSELVTELALYEMQGAKTFHVTTIPGAVGYGYNRATGGGENVLFADGPFLYTVGYGWYSTLHNPKHAALLAAATKLYQRVHGHPAN